MTMCEVVLKEGYHWGILDEVMQLLNAEAVEVLVDLNHLPYMKLVKFRGLFGPLLGAIIDGFFEVFA